VSKRVVIEALIDVISSLLWFLESYPVLGQTRRGLNEWYNYLPRVFCLGRQSQTANRNINLSDLESALKQDDSCVHDLSLRYIPEVLEMGCAPLFPVTYHIS
jgi:hypothetical protein